MNKPNQAHFCALFQLVQGLIPELFVALWISADDAASLLMPLPLSPRIRRLSTLDGAI